ncbi:hypothetical protein GIW32_22580 [Pseudomonas syringae]|nr:hypothetical protein [Pseudomonas syringae]MCF5244868.1 hypothetical protein [Pseudomonas syringae]
MDELKRLPSNSFPTCIVTFSRGVNAFEVFFFGWDFTGDTGAISGAADSACGAGTGLPKRVFRISSSAKSVFMEFLVRGCAAGLILPVGRSRDRSSVGDLCIL